MARNIHISRRKKNKNTESPKTLFFLKYLSKKNGTWESLLLHSGFLGELHGHGHHSGRLTSGGAHTFSFISNLQHTPTQHKPLTGAAFKTGPSHHDTSPAHLLMLPQYLHRFLTRFGSPRFQDGRSLSSGGDCGWLEHLSGGRRCGGRGRRSMFRDGALSEVPGGLGQVKGQGRQVTPNPAVTLATLTHNPIPLAVLATVAMETGAAGAWICKKLHPIKTRMRDEIRIILSNILNGSSHTEQQRTIPAFISGKHLSTNTHLAWRMRTESN